MIKRKPPKRKIVTAPYQCAKDCIGQIDHGCSIIGVTKGQFSLLDLIRAVVDQTGPANLTASTWSTGIKDTHNIGTLIDKGMFTSVRLCLDRSFSGRQPKYVSEVIETWGEENIRMTRNHAKFFLLRNKEWNICSRSSMNLNKNPRLEQFDIDDNLELCEFFENIINDIFEKMPPGLTKRVKKCDQVFPQLLGCGISDQYNQEDIMKDWATLESDMCEDIGRWGKPDR